MDPLARQDTIERHTGDHPDLHDTFTSRAALKRHKTEKNRLQALNFKSKLRSLDELTWRRKVKIWRVNESGRQLFFAAFILLHVLVGAFGFMHYQLKDNLTDARKIFGLGYPIARTSALICHIDLAFILLPVCRNFISLLRRTPLNDFIPFDKNITFHQAVGWSIVFWSLVHTLAHVVNVVNLAKSLEETTLLRVRRFFLLCVTAGPAITGWIMWIALGAMAWTAREPKRRQNFERFWYTHHLFFVFFIGWQLHGLFCMIKTDRPPYCKGNGAFWKYWVVGGAIWIVERILREVRGQQLTYVSKVIQHPSNVMELQIKKPSATVRAGDYIFISCPEVSKFQWHPFTLTSAPEEDYLSVHIRCVGDFTKALAKSMGVDFRNQVNRSSSGVLINTQANDAVTEQEKRKLPRIKVDGPFGSASEDFFKYEVVLLVGAGIGATPFVSILKTIWYRLNNDVNAAGKPTRLSKVYFTWVIRDFGSAEWFHSLLRAIEELDMGKKIEISIYLTAKLNEADMHHIMVNDIGAEADTLTSLRAPTHYGRPNFDKIFGNLTEQHPETDVGVFFCGPKALSSTLHTMSNKYSTHNGTRFFFGKENF